MKRKLGLIALTIIIFYSYNGHSQTVIVECEEQLKELKNDSIENLVINFPISRNFDYGLIPENLKVLRFIHKSRNLTQAGVLIERIDSLHLIELNGKMSEFLPEIVYHNNQLDTVVLTNSRLSQIWDYTPFISNDTLDILVLNDFIIDEKCEMYIALFKGGSLKINKIILNSKSKISTEQQVLLMDVFDTKELYINGKKQNVYID